MGRLAEAGGWGIGPGASRPTPDLAMRLLQVTSDLSSHRAGSGANLVHPLTPNPQGHQAKFLEVHASVSVCMSEGLSVSMHVCVCVCECMSACVSECVSSMWCICVYDFVCASMCLSP